MFAKPSAVPFVALLIGGSYLMQRRRFMLVDSAAHRLVMTCEPQRPIAHNRTRAERHR